MEIEGHPGLEMIFQGVIGSRAYGTDTPASDTDMRGVFVNPPSLVLSPFPSKDEARLPGDDSKAYELAKYVRLACEQNPNMVEMLWLEPRFIMHESPAWKILRESRHRLLTTRIRATYGGFASDTLRQLRGRDRWLTNPQPEQAPRPCDFVSMVHNVALGKEWNSSVPTEGDWTAVGCGRDLYLLYQGGRGSWFDASGNLRTFTRKQAEGVSARSLVAIVAFDRQTYEARKRDHGNYWTWRRERNVVRGALEERHGYDCKNAGHLIRLLRTAEEVLREGVVRVYRPDRRQLLAIRNGEYTYEQVVAMAEEIEARLPEAEASSSLPRELDQGMVAGLTREIYQRAWKDTSVHRSVQPTVDPFRGRHAPDVRDRIVVIDVEMTGYADPGRRQVIEVGAVEIVGGLRTGRTFHSYVDPGSRLNVHATQVHGLNRSFLRGKPGFEVVGPDLLEFVGDSSIVAHGAENDMRAINNDLILVGLQPFARGRAACTERIARHLLGYVSLSQDALCDVLDVDRGPRLRGHSAALDASLCADCLLLMSGMPGYDQAHRAWINGDTTRSRASDSLLTTAEVSASLEDGVICFRQAGQEAVTHPVPGHPGSHHVVASGNKVVVMQRDMPQGRWVPDNPCGPAVVSMRDGKVRERWFSHGARQPAPALDEPSPSPR